MAQRLTDKQELFARGLFRGLSNSDAYREAYPASLKWQHHALHNKASLLSKHGGVQVRLTQLRLPVERALQYTVVEAMEEALQAFEVARQEGSGSGMVAAATLRSKLHGLLVEKREVKITSLDHFAAPDKQMMISELTQLLEQRKRLAAPVDVTDVVNKADASSVELPNEDD